MGKAKNIRLIVDESFIDFVSVEDNASLLAQDVLEKYPNLIVIKSISRSYGVPGLRLGVAASNDLKLIAAVRKDVAIWNINSFAEFYLQIFEKYQLEYKEALDRCKAVRAHYMEELQRIPGVLTFPSQGNYIMLKLPCNMTARELTKQLLIDYRILIKDLSGKLRKDKYVGVAVRSEEDNQKLLDALKKVLGHDGI